MISMNLINSYIPDYKISSLNEITDEILDHMKYNIGIEAIMLDIDGTITTHHGIEINKNTEQFLNMIKEKEFPVCFITNCSTRRYYDTIAHFGKYSDNKIFYSEKTHHRKPFRYAFTKPAKELDTDLNNCIYIGDQYSTDIWGAKNAGIGHTIKFDNGFAGNEPKIKKVQRYAEDKLYNILKNFTKKQPKNIEEILRN